MIDIIYILLMSGLKLKAQKLLTPGRVGFSAVKVHTSLLHFITSWVGRKGYLIRLKRYKKQSQISLYIKINL